MKNRLDQIADRLYPYFAGIEVAAVTAGLLLLAKGGDEVEREYGKAIVRIAQEMVKE
jgi:hypothetical protein